MLHLIGCNIPPTKRDSNRRSNTLDSGSGWNCGAVWMLPIDLCTRPFLKMNQSRTVQTADFLNCLKASSCSECTPWVNIGNTLWWHASRILKEQKLVRLQEQLLETLFACHIYICKVETINDLYCLRLFTMATCMN